MFKQIVILLVAVANLTNSELHTPVFPEQVFAKNNETTDTLPTQIDPPDSNTLTSENGTYSRTIIGGSEASIGQIPFQALITSWKTGIFWAAGVCGGSLIKPSWVLTAAHCFTNNDYSAVYLGMNRRGQHSYEGISYNRIIHPNYNSVNLNNDLALIQLPTAASGPNIATIALAPANIGSLVNVVVRASGYGKTSEYGATSNQLMYVDLKTISNSICRDLYGSKIIVDSTLCATFTKEGIESVCSGDSGGPLTYNNKLVGVTSFVSENGCESGIPSGFVRISSFRTWIDANTK